MTTSISDEETITTYTVHVTWMDGTKDTFPVTEFDVHDGIIDLSVGDVAWGIPLRNVRVWQVAR
jgi:hypothetical protein